MWREPLLSHIHQGVLVIPMLPFLLSEFILLTNFIYVIYYIIECVLEYVFSFLEGNGELRHHYSPFLFARKI
jgi:hypothetical protein